MDRGHGLWGSRGAGDRGSIIPASDHGRCKVGQAVNVYLETAVDSYKRLIRAERALDKRKQELENALRHLPTEKIAEYVRRTEDKQ
jgi:hypothetical protein